MINKQLLQSSLNESAIASTIIAIWDPNFGIGLPSIANPFHFHFVVSYRFV